MEWEQVMAKPKIEVGDWLTLHVKVTKVLRAIAAELAAAGHLNERGAPYSAKPSPRC